MVAWPPTVCTVHIFSFIDMRILRNSSFWSLGDSFWVPTQLILVTVYSCFWLQCTVHCKQTILHKFSLIESTYIKCLFRLYTVYGITFRYFRLRFIQNNILSDRLYVLFDVKHVSNMMLRFIIGTRRHLQPVQRNFMFGFAVYLTFTYQIIFSIKGIEVPCNETRVSAARPFGRNQQNNNLSIN